MDFIYLNSNKSGIGDRIHDLILIFTYSQYMKCDKLYLNWTEDKNNMVGSNSIYSKIRSEKTSFREKDYLLENLQNFIEFPNEINFISSDELNNKSTSKNVIVFKDYLGLGYGIKIFIKKFLNFETIEIKNKFEENYFKNFQKIKLKNINSELTNYFKQNSVVTIHLRRGDKVVNDGGITNNIQEFELNNLDSITESFIDYIINSGYSNICFVSDEYLVKNKYINKYDKKCNIIKINSDPITRTYIDLYCLSNSKIIFMSQKFSVFSLLGKLIGNNKLYYIWNQSKIKENRFNEYNGMIQYNM
jgi:hypothetical protein